MESLMRQKGIGLFNWEQGVNFLCLILKTTETKSKSALKIPSKINLDSNYTVLVGTWKVNHIFLSPKSTDLIDVTNVKAFTLLLYRIYHICTLSETSRFYAPLSPIHFSLPDFLDSLVVFSDIQMLCIQRYHPGPQLQYLTL